MKARFLTTHVRNDELVVGDVVVTNSRMQKTSVVKEIDTDPNHLSVWRNHRKITLENGDHGLYYNGATMEIPIS